MESITLRYGESLTLPLDTGDSTAQSATIYIGKPGEPYVISKLASLTDGAGVFVFDNIDTSVPIGTYYYQINVLDVNGYVEKYPSPEDVCHGGDNEFPQFVVCESLDEMEVIS